MGRRWWDRRPTTRLPATEVGERLAWTLTIVVLGITLFGLVMVLSASSVTSVHRSNASPFLLFARQLRYAAIGLVAFAVGSRIDYRWTSRLAVPGALVSAGLLTLLLVPGIGRNVNGSSRWLQVGPVVIQPAELAKVALILLVASLLSERMHQMARPERTVRPVMVITMGFSLLLLAQPKLGTPVIMWSVAMLMLLVAQARLRDLARWTFLGLVGAGLLAWAEPYRWARILAFLDPWADADGSGLQTIQSRIGVVAGGLLGRGLGASRQKWGFLPEAQTDFIFSVVAEELGIVGAGAFIGAIALLCYLGMLAAMRAPDEYGRLLAAGVVIWIGVQAMLNVGMTLGLAPITGEPLPFLSLGGSSLITTLFSCGLLVSVARRGRP